MNGHVLLDARAVVPAHDGKLLVLGPKPPNATRSPFAIMATDPRRLKGVRNPVRIDAWDLPVVANRPIALPEGAWAVAKPGAKNRPMKRMIQKKERKMGLDDLARFLGKDSDRIRRDALRELKDRYAEEEDQRLNFEDSITPKSTTFLVRIPRLSEKAARDPSRRQAVLNDAIRTVRLVKGILGLAEETLYYASGRNEHLTSWRMDQRERS